MNKTYPPIPLDLQKRLLQAGWKGEMRFDGMSYTQARGPISLGSWLVLESADVESVLDLFRACLKAGLPFVHPHPQSGKDHPVHLLHHLIPRSFNQAVWDILFEEGLDINQKMEWGETILMRACDYASGSAEKDEFFLYLLSKKPDFSLKNDEGETVLLRLAMESPFDVPWLLDQGANPQEVMKNPDATEVQSTLLSRVLSGILNNHQHVSQEKVEFLLEACVARGADVHTLVRGETLLYFALPRCLQAMPFLINQGVDISLPNKDGFSLIELLQQKITPESGYAFYNEKNEMIQKIIDLITLKMRDNLEKSLPNAPHQPRSVRM